VGARSFADPCAHGAGCRVGGSGRRGAGRGRERDGGAARPATAVGMQMGVRGAVWPQGLLGAFSALPDAQFLARGAGGLPFC